MRRTEHTRRRADRGTQVVELAVALPLLLLLTYVVTEGAAVVRIHQIVNNAAREGARISALTENAGQPGVATTAAKNYLSTYAPNNCTAVDATANQAVVIGTSSGINIIGSSVTVTCTYNALWIPGFFGVPRTFPLSSTAVFRNFY